MSLSKAISHMRTQSYGNQCINDMVTGFDSIYTFLKLMLSFVVVWWTEMGLARQEECYNNHEKRTLIHVRYVCYTEANRKKVFLWYQSYWQTQKLYTYNCDYGLAYQRQCTTFTMDIMKSLYSLLLIVGSLIIQNPPYRPHFTWEFCHRTKMVKYQSKNLLSKYLVIHFSHLITMVRGSAYNCVGRCCRKAV